MRMSRMSDPLSCYDVSHLGSASTGPAKPVVREQ
jgi:hypothetical protein